MLNLPRTYYIYNTLPITLLKLYRVRERDNPKDYDPLQLADNNIYEVKVILDYKGRGKSRRYKVRQLEYSLEDNQQLLVRNLNNSSLL